MITWHDQIEYPATNRGNLPPFPVLDYLIVVVMLIIGACGYQAARATHDNTVARGENSSLALTLSCAAQTVNGGAR